jgi:hypothetical protein
VKNCSDFTEPVVVQAARNTNSLRRFLAGADAKQRHSPVHDCTAAASPGAIGSDFHAPYSGSEIQKFPLVWLNA